LLKQQVVVENRASASGVIAGELTAKAPPDGYTLLLAYHQHTINGALSPNLPYHPVNDFTPITQLTRAGLLLVVHPDSPPRTLQRVAARPDVPAVAEAIPGCGVVGWDGVSGPAGMPGTLVERLHHGLLRGLAQPDVHERIVKDGSEPVGNSPREFRDFMAADLA